jgi:arginine/ornithine permease
MGNVGLAPKLFSKVNSSGVPFFGVLATAVLSAVALLTRYFGSDDIFILMASTTGIIGCIIWIMISWGHLGFRKNMKIQGKDVKELKFRAPMFPYVPIAGIVANILIIAGMFFDPIQRVAFYLTAGSIVVLFFCYKFFIKPPAE